MQTKQRIHRDERTGGRQLVELLQLLEAGIAFTAVTVTAVSAPVMILSGESLPNIDPVVESVVNKEETPELKQ